MRLLPDPQRQGDIHFLIAKSLPYRTRLCVIAGLMFTGLCVQLLFQFWAGLLLLAAGTALSLIRGYKDIPPVQGEEAWSQVTPDEYTKIRIKERQLQRWDQDFFDGTNPLGLSLFAGFAACFFVAWIVLKFTNKDTLALYLFWDGIVILAPHWVTGTREYLKKDRLIIKIDMLEKIMRYLEAPSDIQVLPMLSTQEVLKEGRVPADARLMVRLLNAPEFFLGVQVQVSLNSVQGTFYPYVYCVVLAKKEAHLFEKKERLIPQKTKKILYELRESNDVDVLVVRQHTTQTSGYHTDERAACYVVQTAIDLARSILE